MSSPVTVASLQVSGITVTTTPALAPIGTGLLTITLKDPVSGWLETIQYQDSSVLDFWTTASPGGSTFADVVAIAALNKLVADGKLPAGTISE